MVGQEFWVCVNGRIEGGRTKRGMAPLLFALNGRRVELENVDLRTTLLEFLRVHARLTGTKLGCGEGGCGACVVVRARYDPTTDTVEEVSINSCVALLGSVHLCAVTTIEGLGSSKTRLHAIQRRFLGFHASQCGFCTPGMCMSLYGGLKHLQSRQKSFFPSSAGQTSSVSYEARLLERSIQGNICRCTGYRPIIDVCKSFGSDVDIEDLGLNTFWKDGKDARAELLPSYDPSDDPQFPDFLKHEIIQRNRESKVDDDFTAAADVVLEEARWIRATSFSHAFGLLKRFRESDAMNDKMKIVVGNTSAGVYREWDHIFFVDISSIPELHRMEETSYGVEIGAAVTISKLINFLENKDSRRGGRIFGAIAKHLSKVGTPHVRNAGSIGGNLIMARDFGFDSDIATVLLAAGARLMLLVGSPEKETVQSMDEFLEGGSGLSLLISICIPFGSDAVEFETYRASPRPLGNAVACANAAFLARFSEHPIPGHYRLEDSRLTFGAVGYKHAFRVIQVEEFLGGKTITAAVLLKAIEILKTELAPKTETRPKSAYRAALAVSFFFKFFRKKLGVFAGSGEYHVKDHPRSLICGRQEVHQGERRRALGQPSEKLMANLQVTGEAVYVDDLPCPSDTLHAAFVYSQKAHARIKEVSTGSAMACPGAVKFLSVRDIPRGGGNVGIKSDLANESLFAECIVECVGQAIGLMVADTPANARKAADKVQITYDTEAVERPPIITIEDAVSSSSTFKIPDWYLSTLDTKSGDISEGFARAEHVIEDAEVTTPGQYYFYMETNVAFSVPDEDGCLTVYSACQAPEHVQASVAACLGIPMHNVRVITRRVGGAFGGKTSKACMVAAACALAAHNLGRPVRLSMDRKTDMAMMGGREPTKAVYSVGFTSSGKITALRVRLILQGGWSMDMSWLFAGSMLHALKKFDYGALEVELVVCKTNVPSRSPMRAPGDAPGSFVADAIIAHVAAYLKLDVHDVMDANLHTLRTAEVAYGANFVDGEVGFTLPSVLARVRDRAGFVSRREFERRFNAANRWKKRGVALVQSTYLVFLVPKPARVSVFSDGSVVVEVGGVELGQGLWTKVRQATAFALSELFEDEEEGVPVSRIRVVQTDSISVANGNWTVGSTSSESSCEATRICCAAIVARLWPIRENLLSSSQPVTWDSIVATARMTNVDLSAQAHFVAPPEAAAYLTYGAAISEVEIDVLTGEVELLRTDMVYDCGKSMNPAVDIGQVEGAFTQGLGYLTTEEYVVDEEGRLVSDGTWTYKPPTADNLPKILNIEFINSPVHEKRILSSKTSGEPPLLLAGSVLAAIRIAVAAARSDNGRNDYFRMDPPVTIDRVRTLCGLENVEDYLKSA